MSDFLPALTQSGPDVVIQVKVVPGASRGRVVGMLGDRVKVQVAAPPEAGQANRALCALLAEALGVGRQSVTVAAGAANPRKTVRAAGMTVAQAAQRLAR